MFMPFARGARSAGGGASTFPVWETADNVGTAITSGTTSHVLSVATNVASGNLLQLFFLYRGPIGHIASPPTGWTTTASGNLGGTGFAAFLFEKISDGTETTATVTSSSSRQSTTLATRITGAGGLSDATVNGNNSSGIAIDPPSHTPSGGSQKYLWQAWACVESNSIDHTAPTNYTDGAASYSVSGTGQDICYRELEASSEDPGAFGNGNAAGEWLAMTIAIPPA